MSYGLCIENNIAIFLSDDIFQQEKWYICIDLVLK